MVDLFIEPKGLRKYGILDVKKAEEIYELGYKEAKKILDQRYLDLGQKRYQIVR